MGDPRAGVPEQWRRNLYAIYVAQFSAIFGLSFARPFLPLFLTKELGLTEPHELALWTGVSSAALGVGLGLIAPVWGAVADRIGRKPMLIRATLGGTLTVGLMALSRSPVEYSIEWLLFGILSGTAPVAIALVASETPKEHVGWALGVTTSATALGGSLGPALAGLTITAFGLRSTYLVGAAIEALAILPVILVVRETAFHAHRAERGSDRTPWRSQLTHGRLRAVLVLLGSQALFLVAWQGAAPLVVLRLNQLTPTQAALLTGIAFGLAGALSAVAGFSYARVARRIGYRRTAMAAASVSAALLLLVAIVPSAVAIVALVAVNGVSTGVVQPAVAAMLGFESPTRIQATLFGFLQTANAVGLFAGPLIGGGVAGVFDASVALACLAIVGATLVLLLAGWGREPVPHTPAPAAA